MLVQGWACSDIAAVSQYVRRFEAATLFYSCKGLRKSLVASTAGSMSYKMAQSMQQVRWRQLMPAQKMPTDGKPGAGDALMFSLQCLWLVS